jgi:hypothetical protein
VDTTPVGVEIAARKLVRSDRMFLTFIAQLFPQDERVYDCSISTSS